MTLSKLDALQWIPSAKLDATPPEPYLRNWPRETANSPIADLFESHFKAKFSKPLVSINPRLPTPPVFTDYLQTRTGKYSGAQAISSVEPNDKYSLLKGSRGSFGRSLHHSLLEWFRIKRFLEILRESHRWPVF